MRTVRVLGSFCLALAVPVLAGSPYYYNLTVAPFSPTGSLSLNGWTATWQSEALLIPTECVKTMEGGPNPEINLAAQTGFTLSGVPEGGSAPNAFYFCINDEPSAGGRPLIEAVWTSGDQIIDYDFEFSTTTPPFMTGTFPTVETLFAGVTYSGALATLTISQPGAPPPPPPPAPGWALARIRVSLVLAGPVTPPPGSPVEAVVGFVDINGDAVGQPRPVSLIPGQLSTVDLDASTFVQPAQHLTVFPVITPATPGALLPPIQVTTEVFDSRSGLGAVLATAPGISPPNPTLAPQGLGVGQTMRVTATAFLPDPCMATISFTDANGAPVGPNLSVNLAPGQSKALDLPGSLLPAVQNGEHVEVRPVVTLQSPAGAAFVSGASACAAVADVFEQASGRTSTYQYAVVR